MHGSGTFAQSSSEATGLKEANQPAQDARALPSPDRCYRGHNPVLPNVESLKIAASRNVPAPPNTIHFCASLPVGPLDLIKNSALAEMSLLRLLPTAEHLVNGKEFYLGKSIHMLLVYRFQSWPVIMFCSDFLTLRAVEIFEIFLGYHSCAVPGCDLVQPCD